MKRLILVGSTINPVHIKNYYNLIKDYFDEILIIGSHKIYFCDHKIIDFSLKNPLKVYQSIHQLRKIIKDFQPSLIHIHQANSVAFITSKANKGMYPQVLTTWGDDVLTNPYKSKVLKYITTYSLKASDYVTADAQSMADSIARFYKKIPVKILNFGIDLFENSTVDKKNIIYSNRLHNDLYNIDQIILGCETFLSTNPDWKLVLAAEGNNTEKLKELAAQSKVANQIEFVGFLPPEKNRQNYFDAKIYVSIPRTDGTAISLLECLAYGCLPIVSNIPSNREWIEDGINGIIDKGDLNESLQRAMKLDAEKVKQLNTDIINSRATKESNRKGFYEIYDQIMAKLS